MLGPYAVNHVVRFDCILCYNIVMLNEQTSYGIDKMGYPLGLCEINLIFIFFLAIVMVLMTIFFGFETEMRRKGERSSVCSD